MFPCIICNKTFTAKKNMVRHMRYYDNKSTNFCNILCSKTYSQCHDLQTLFTNVHQLAIRGNLYSLIISIEFYNTNLLINS